MKHVVKKPDYSKYTYARVDGKSGILDHTNTLLASSVGVTHAPVVLRSTLKSMPLEHKKRLLNDMISDGVCIKYYPELLQCLRLQQNNEVKK